jgi:hypothetical protein
MVVEMRSTRAMLLEVLVNRGMARGGLPSMGPWRWESGGVKWSWFSPWPGSTPRGRLWWLEGEMLGPVALVCGAAQHSGSVRGEEQGTTSARRRRRCC